MKTIDIVIIICTGALLFSSCRNREAGEEISIPPISVTVAPVTEGNIEDYLLLNGKTIFLKKNRIVAPVSAIVTKVNVQFGDIVNDGEVLFELQTRENRALNNNTSNLKVLALSGGTVTGLAVNQPGAYVMEGDLLCLLVENRDLVIQVSVPFQYNKMLRQGTQCRILLPDMTEFTAAIASILPEINESDQTQSVLLKPVTPLALPENLNLSVRFVLNSHPRSLLVSREALMTNEKQTVFWLMKIVQDSLAIKIPVENMGKKQKKTIENPPAARGTETGNTNTVSVNSAAVPTSAVSND